MAYKQGKILCSREEIQEYCEKNIDGYDVEPIVREAYIRGLIDVSVFYIHLRIAEKEAKGGITYKQIADEVGFTPSLINKYRNNRMTGINEKIFVMIILDKYRKNMLSIWEENDFNQALADYINGYYRLAIDNSISTESEEENEIFERNTKRIKKERYWMTVDVDGKDVHKIISKDVCRKVYRDYLKKKVGYISLHKAEKRACGGGDKTFLVSVKIRSEEGTTTVVEFQWKNWFVEKSKCVECDKANLVHEVVKQIQNMLGGWSTKERYREIYLQADQNRKLRHAIEYVAMSYDDIFLVSN